MPISTRLRNVFSKLRRNKSKQKSRTLSSPANNSPQQNPKAAQRQKTLAQASRQGDIIAVTEILQKCGATPEGEESLRAAASNGHADIVLLLLQHGIDPNRLDSIGQAALHEAVIHGHGKVVRLLVENGADPFIGTVPILWLAELYWNKRPLELLRELLRKHHPERFEEEHPTPARPAVKPEVKKAPVKAFKNSIRDSPASLSKDLWPDRVFTSRGERISVAPSDPAYWN
ncbi:hypothetical protein N7474_004465 [Penicillium riverlandense]|uniref:uncharacterized protein n=1 Tax=Penicillium riverlandense TaxID=1903569 RepID=UPI00254975B3|nr:uncharacterized protein N7474_004465 [Penicillium riverlandense]KAJ5818874.1 hypothetical protein N7474_004465 [Penicillium riverlandense]